MNTYIAKPKLRISALAFPRLVIPVLILPVLALILAIYSLTLFAKVEVAQSWPMQAGESVDDLARLFYPKNKNMQRQFSAAVLKLNQGSQAGLNASLNSNINPANSFEQPTTILIPDIKLLSKKSKHQVSQSSALKSQTVNNMLDSGIGVQRQADYEALLKRNTFFKQQLANLNTKLDHLQQVLATLKVNLMHLIEGADEANASQLTSTPMVMQPAVVQNVLATQDAMLTTKAEAMQNKVLAKKTILTKEITQQFPYFYWILAITFSLLTLGTLLTHYARRQASNIKLFANANIQPLEKNAFVEKFIYVKTAATPAQITPHLPAGLIVPNTLDEDGLENKEDAKAILEQAKAYVYLGRKDGAIRLLIAYINAEPKIALQHWLYLLEIYRQMNQKQSFLESAKKLHRTFNVVMPEWEKSDVLPMIATNTPKASLEAYAHIVDKVSKLWTDCEQEAQKISQTKKYLDQLMMDHRDGKRIGFSLEAFEDILMLRDTLEAKETLAQNLMA